jgi:uncharacterized damage-inducible protein DinB
MIMKAIEYTSGLFDQLRDAISKLDKEQYQHPSEVLFKSTIGQHVRHVIELFVELINGYETGYVDYEKRKRDLQIETDPSLAIEKLSTLSVLLDKSDRELLLTSEYSLDGGNTRLVPTNYFRELIYNIEHTVHHMALIRAAMSHMSVPSLSAEFGVAMSTLKYRKACAQ